VTEPEWLASDDPGTMLYAVQGPEPEWGGFPTRKISDRKLRLFACACLRVRDLFRRLDLDAMEAYADAGVWPYDQEKSNLFARALLGLSAPEMAQTVCGPTTDNLLPQADKAALLRCLIGNPWRPARPWEGSVDHLEADAPVHWRIVTWGGGLVPKLARAIYDARDWAALPVLADALEEAGCPAEEACPDCAGTGKPFHSGGRFNHPHHGCALCGGRGRFANPLLAHLRGPGPHARGCWVVDLILGRT
jgi:hypothetical protein